MTQQTQNGAVHLALTAALVLVLITLALALVHAWTVLVFN